MSIVTRKLEGVNHFHYYLCRQLKGGGMEIIMTKTICLYEKEEYQYPCAGEFLPNLTAYLHDDGERRPAMLVVPGGGYVICHGKPYRRGDCGKEVL